VESGSLLQRLARLRDGRLDESELADTIIALAHSDLLNRDDVRRDLVRMVSHPGWEVRSEAMRALAYHGVSFRWEVDPGRRFLAHVCHDFGGGLA
jgi:HEAT repeat protein